MQEHNPKEIKMRIIEAGYKAIDELISVAEDKVFRSGEEDTDLGADKLKNAAASKKLAIFDAFEILSRIEAEKAVMSEEHGKDKKSDTGNQGFAERRSK
jgi:hypothetical protein